MSNVIEELEKLFEQDPDAVLRWFLDLPIERWPDIAVARVQDTTSDVFSKAWQRPPSSFRLSD